MYLGKLPQWLIGIALPYSGYIESGRVMTFCAFVA